MKVWWRYNTSDMNTRQITCSHIWHVDIFIRHTFCESLVKLYVLPNTNTVDFYTIAITTLTDRHFLFLFLISWREFPQVWESYFSTDLGAGNIFCMCVCMYMCILRCIHPRVRNFNPIDTTFCTQGVLVKSKVWLEDEICRPHRDPQDHYQKTKI